MITLFEEYNNKGWSKDLNVGDYVILNDFFNKEKAPWHLSYGIIVSQDFKKLWNVKILTPGEEYGNIESVADDWLIGYDKDDWDKEVEIIEIKKDAKKYNL